MAIRRWDPLQDLLTLQERMNRLFEESLARGRPEGDGLPSGGWTPLADVYDMADRFVVQVELPGLLEDDVHVQVDGDTLSLRGERRMRGSRPDCFYRMERSFGPFSRVIQVPEEIDPEGVVAQFKDGLLRIELPKVRPRASWRGRSGAGT